MHLDACTHTTIFLRAIASLEYADIVSTLQMNIDAYYPLDDDAGYLPQHFCLSNVAQLIKNKAKAPVHGIGSSQINRVGGLDSPYASLADDDFPCCLIQGYQPWVFWAEQSCDHIFPDRGSDRRVSDCRSDRVGVYGGQKAGPPQGRYAHPDNVGDIELKEANC